MSYNFILAEHRQTDFKCGKSKLFFIPCSVSLFLITSNLCYLHDLKPGNRIGFKVTMGREIVYSTGAITAIENDHVRIDELVLRKKDLVPILLTADTLVKLGCEELSAKLWRTPHFTDFEFDGIQARIGDGSARICYLHLFQNMVAQLGEELITNM